MAPNILNSSSQDVIMDDSSFFDSSSLSSKSTDLNSHLTSPNMSQKSDLSPKIINMNPTGHNNISPLQQEDKSSCNPNTLHESSISHNHVEEVQSFEKCKVDHVDKDLKSCDLLIRSTSTYHEVNPALKPLSKPTKLSTTSRIAEFFNKAKSSRRESVLWDQPYYAYYLHLIVIVHLNLEE